MAIWSAMQDVREGRTLPVPKHLRDTHYKGSARLGHGSDYKYAHDYKDGFVRQDYLGVDKSYYQPTDRGYEREIAQRLEAWRGQKENISINPHQPDATDGIKGPPLQDEGPSAHSKGGVLEGRK